MDLDELVRLGLRCDLHFEDPWTGHSRVRYLAHRDRSSERVSASTDIQRSSKLISCYCSLKASVSPDAANVKFEVADFFALEDEAFDLVYDYT